MLAEATVVAEALDSIWRTHTKDNCIVGQWVEAFCCMPWHSGNKWIFEWIATEYEKRFPWSNSWMSSSYDARRVFCHLVTSSSDDMSMLEYMLCITKFFFSDDTISEWILCQGNASVVHWAHTESYLATEIIQEMLITRVVLDDDVMKWIWESGVCKKDDANRQLFIKSMHTPETRRSSSYVRWVVETFEMASATLTDELIFALACQANSTEDVRSVLDCWGGGAAESWP
jgi:hypothetical protein